MSRIYVGIGGWVFEPWRGTFYPSDVSQKKELEYASRKLSSIEINSTYYGSQKPETFAKWRDETPEGFLFSVKGPRFATNRRVLAESGESIARFIDSGVLELKDRLGPINWQFMATKAFDPIDFAAFLSLLPREAGGRALRHAIEVRHPSFNCAEFIALARAHNVAVILAGDSEFPQIAALTADFAFVRIMGTGADTPEGYGMEALKSWAERAKALSEGQVPADLGPVVETSDGKPRDVFMYVISGEKDRNPFAAMKLIEMVA